MPPITMCLASLCLLNGYTLRSTPIQLVLAQLYARAFNWTLLFNNPGVTTADVCIKSVLEVVADG